MKHSEIIPSFLLLSYVVYSAFIPVTIAHSIILASLAGLFGYTIYLYNQKQPSMQKELVKYHEKMELEMKQQKEFYEQKLIKVENVVSGLAIANTRPTSPASRQPQDKKIIF